jgi:hypothetical protein
LIIDILVKELEAIFTRIRGKASEETKHSEHLLLLVKLKEVQGLYILNITSNLTGNTVRMEDSTSLERSDSCESNTDQKAYVNIVIDLERKHKELEAKYTKLQNYYDRLVRTYEGRIKDLKSTIQTLETSGVKLHTSNTKL